MLISQSPPELETPPVPKPQTKPEPSTRPSFYHPELDGLRFFAFLGVFTFHVWGVRPSASATAPAWLNITVEWFFSAMAAGAAGVDLFFILSAYLLTQLLVREQQLYGKIDIPSFYLRRSLRIWPLYYAFLIFAVFWESSLLGNAGLSWDTAAWFAVFLGNWACTPLEFLPNTTAVILWTVSMEEQFYLVFPWLFRACSGRRLVGACLVLMACSSLVRAWLVLSDATSYAFTGNTFARMEPLCLGILLGLIPSKRLPNLSPGLRRSLMGLGLLGLVITYRYYTILNWEANRPWYSMLHYPVVALSCGLIFWGSLQPLGQARGVFTWKPLVFLGRISYGLYVFHMVGVRLVDRYLADRFWLEKSLLRYSLALSITIVIATASYFLLEKPFLRLKLKFTQVASRPGG